MEPTRRGPAPPARPPTAQEVCYRRAQQAQRESAGWLQAAQQLGEKPSSVHISAPGEKRRIAHVPNPLLAAGGSQRLGNAATSRESPGLAPALPGAVALSGAGWMSMLICEAAPMLVGGAWAGLSWGVRGWLPPFPVCPQTESDSPRLPCRPGLGGSHPGVAPYKVLMRGWLWRPSTLQSNQWIWGRGWA